MTAAQERDLKALGRVVEGIIKKRKKQAHFVVITDDGKTIQVDMHVAQYPQEKP